ncbi:MAG TPA: hypothetical protein VEH84_03190, partial [Alphaproteobacteria bacterium]|nr:hypothetical protein [Alphaproteobacteria bacterium]
EGRRAKEEGRAPKERRQGLVRIDIDRARAVFEEKKARERRGEAFEPAKGVRAVEGNAAEDGRGGRRPAQAAAALYRDGGGEVRAWATAAVYEDSEWAAKKAFGILYVMSERLMGPHSPFEARDRAAPVAPPRRDGDPPDSGGRGPDDPGGWGPGAPDGPPPGSDAGPDKGKDKQNNRDKDKGVGQSGEKSHGHGTAWHDGPDGGGAPGGGKPPRQEDPQPERGRDRR